MQKFHCWISNYNCAKSFLCILLGLICSVISSLSDFSSSWSRGSLSSLLFELLTWVLSQVLLFNWLILSCLWFLSFFFTSYYGAMIVTKCGYWYAIFSLMLGLGANFGVFGRYIIWMFWCTIWKVFQQNVYDFIFPSDFIFQKQVFFFQKI